MRNCNRGEIYWIDPSPYREAVGHVQRAGRPGVIVSSNEINGRIWTYEIVYLTTQPKRESPTHCIILSSKENSTALCEQVQTVSDEQVGSYIGTCTSDEMEAIDECLRISLYLPDRTTTMEEPEEEEDQAESEMQQIEAQNDRLWDENEKLQKQLIEADTEAKILRRLYNELLEKTLRFDKPERTL